MILTKEIEITLKAQTIKYFESKGYVIPKYYHQRRKQWRVKKSTKITIKIEDLNCGSHYLVLCECDNCKIKRMIPFKDYRSLCNNCSKNTIEARLHNSNRQKGKFIGKNNPNYNPFLTDQERINRRTNTFVWEKSVKKLYNYKCQKCGYQGKYHDGYMIAHHLNNYSDFKEQRTDINNGICLCQKCHKQIHSIYGLKTIKEHWINFLQKDLS